MSALPGRPRRRGTGPVVVLQARVPIEVRERAHVAAKALGIPVAAYIEQLVLRDELNEEGRPAWGPPVLDATAEIPGLDQALAADVSSSAA